MGSPGGSAPQAGRFDLASLRMSQDYAAAVGIVKPLTRVPIRKPSKEWWVRTWPDSEYRLVTMVLALDEDDEVYLIDQDLWPHLADEPTVSPRLLVPTITRQGDLFIWPIRLPDANGKVDSWNRSAKDAAETALTRWTRVMPKKSISGYELGHPTIAIPDPKWPNYTFQQILDVAFRDFRIDSWDHPVLRRLQGRL
jgi:hypothetical protein